MLKHKFFLSNVRPLRTTVVCGTTYSLFYRELPKLCMCKGKHCAVRLDIWCVYLAAGNEARSIYFGERAWFASHQKCYADQTRDNNILRYVVYKLLLSLIKRKIVHIYADVHHNLNDSNPVPKVYKLGVCRRKSTSVVHAALMRKDVSRQFNQDKVSYTRSFC